MHNGKTCRDSAIEPSEEIVKCNEVKILGEQETQEDNGGVIEPSEEIVKCNEGKILGEQETQEDNGTAIEPSEEIVKCNEGKILGEQETQEDNGSAIEPSEEIVKCNEGKILGEQETQEDNGGVIEPSEEIVKCNEGKILGEQETQEDNGTAIEPSEEIVKCNEGKILGEQETQEDNGTAIEPSEEIVKCIEGKILGEQETQEDNGSAIEPSEEIVKCNEGKILGEQETQEDNGSAIEPSEEIVKCNEGKILGEQETQEDNGSAIEPSEEIVKCNEVKILGEQETQEDNGSAIEPSEEIVKCNEGKILGEQETQEDNGSAIEPSEEIVKCNEVKILGEQETQEDNGSAIELSEEIVKCNEVKILGEQETQEDNDSISMEATEEVMDCVEPQLQEMSEKEKTNLEAFLNMLMSNSTEQELEEEILSTKSDCMSPLIAYPVFDMTSAGCEHTDIDVLSSDDEWIPPIKQRKKQVFSSSDSSDNSSDCFPNKRKKSDNLNNQKAANQKGSVVWDQVSGAGRSGPAENLIGQVDNEQRISECFENDGQEQIPPEEDIIISSSDSSDNPSDCFPNKRKKSDNLNNQKAANQKGSVVWDQVSGAGRSGPAENLIGQVDNEQRISECFENDGQEQIPPEEEIIRAKDNRNIYIKKVLKNSNINGSSQPRKKLDRVYNRKHCCFICKKMVPHIPSHFKSCHSSVPEVNEAMNNTGKRKFDALRAKGDDLHNKKVIQERKGELIISRRPTEFQTSDFGPCPYCLDWINLKYLTKHTQKVHSSVLQSDKTIAESSSPDSLRTQSKRVLQLESDKLAGRVNKEKNTKLVEVFEIMVRDDVKVVAQGDELICSLEESWMRRNFGNKKAKYYASQHMRLMAKFLMILRKLESSEEGSTCTKTLWDFLVPMKFNLVVVAAIQLAFPYMDDVEDLRSPSNAIKIKYDIIKVINEKWARLKTSENSKQADAEDCETFLKLMTIKWSENVTKMARTVLITRTFSKSIDIPSPEDIKTLTFHICQELRKIDLKSFQEETFKRAIQLSQTRLLLYNKRRSGEIDYISVKQFAARKTKLADIDSSVLGEMSQLEQHLLHSQDLMTVRGKRNRPVPVIIPADVKPALEYLANPEYRKEYGAQAVDWLFPSKGHCCARSYDALNQVSAECQLRFPQRITSVSMRKYTATLTQMMNLSDSELQWACDHLGHTKKVHLQHYRQLSGYLERVQIVKLMIVQDMNLTGNFKGKSLSDKELNDAVLQKIQSEIGIEQDTDDTEQSVPVDIEDTSPTDLDIDIFGSEEPGIQPEEKVEKNKKTDRKRWTEEEMKELNMYFKEFLKTKTCPSKRDCLRAIEKSKTKGGPLAARYC